MAFDILGLSPLVILLILVGVFVFLKMLKWIVLIAVLAAIYFAWQLGMIPGLPAG